MTLLVGLAASSCGRETAAAGPARPNVLLISIDTLRADHLACYGYERATSPRLDALAASGTRFARAYSSSSWTLPAHVTLFTGLPVSGHGVCDDRLFTRPAPDGGPLPVLRRGRMLAEQLAADGYRTAGFYSWKYLEPKFGFDPGFEVYERFGHTFYPYAPVWEEYQRLEAAKDREGLKALAARHPDLFDATTPSSDDVVDAGIEWIESTTAVGQDEPFFAFLHLFDVHDPYTPPAPFDRMFDPEYDGPIDGTGVTTKNSLVTRDMPSRDLEHLKALYDGEIAWVDHQLGRLFDRLDDLGLRDDTLIVVVSDHGEEFFEHGQKGHRNNLHEETVHVPWILSWPRGLAGGRVVEVTVGLEDVAPTILGLCELDGLPGATGSDLSAALRDEEPFADREVWSELLHFEVSDPPRREVALRRGHETYLSAPRASEQASLEIYDAAVDLQERDPRHARLGDEAARPFELALDAFRTRLLAVRTRLPLVWLGADHALDEADLAELSAWGYTGASGTTAPEHGSEYSEHLCVDGCVFAPADEAQR